MSFFFTPWQKAEGCCYKHVRLSWTFQFSGSAGRVSSQVTSYKFIENWESNCPHYPENRKEDKETLKDKKAQKTDKISIKSN